MSSESNPAAWHARDLESVWRALKSTEQGLTRAEAAARLKKFGRNKLPEEPPPRWWQILLRQFQSPLIYILLAAAVVAVIVRDFTDAGFIAAVLAINAAIGGYEEWRAEQSSRALQRLLHIRASVVRDGGIQEIDADQLVPGDVVWLESGNRVPADLRLVSAHGLEIDESLLTGESLPVTKDAAWRGRGETPVADRLNTAYAGSIVIHGRGQGVTVETGASTMVGQLATDVLRAGGGRPPLLERMERFAQTIAYVVLAAVLVISLLGIVMHGHTAHEMFLFGVALAVSAIPEGLPAALTVALAIATTRMARRGVIVRRLAAVEGLGSCTMIASDKTGTLTRNQLTVRAIRLPDGSDLEVRGVGFAPEGEVLLNGKPVHAGDNDALFHAVRIAVLCNEADLYRAGEEWTWRGDPTDVALLTFGQKAGLQRQTLLERYPQVGEIPFEPEYRFAASFHDVDGTVCAFVKGAPERVLAMCDWKEQGAESRGQGACQEKPTALLPAPRSLLPALQAAAERMAEQGFRVLALADGPAERAGSGERGAWSRQRGAANLNPDSPLPAPRSLLFRGFVGMIDPLRKGVREAVEACEAAGITVSMITGDHPVTALAIARDLGLATNPDQVITGSQLAEGSEEEIRAAIRRCRVFARVAPQQKLQLVEAARAEGHIVAVTGDGVNDAPALRDADIGVAMGKAGTDVAREAAELVISDDNFATIVSGVEEGRVAYDNVRKVIFLLVSTGAAEVLLIGLVFAIGPWLPLPLLPVQLLWLNLVTNGIQGVALAFEPAEEGVLRRKPRPPSEPIFNRLMIERTLVAACLMALVGVAAFWWMIRAGWPEDAARNALLLLMVLFENFHIGNCRSETRSALSLSPFRSPFLLIGAGSAFLIHVLAMHLPPLQAVLRTEPVSAATWLTLIGLALSIFVAMELHKWTWRLRGHET